jgi:hypothetical protein
VNFAIYALALFAFERFWLALDGARRAWDRDAGVAGFGAAAWWALGYALFGWAALAMIEVWAVTPDLCVATAVFLASALLVRVATQEGSARAFAALGAVLGAGYLAKAILFPMGLAVVAVAALAGGPWRGALRRAAPALLAFALLAGPWIGALSAAKGRFTFSDVGSFTYLKHVLGVPTPHWRAGVADDLGRPRDPVRLAHADPAVWEFATPVGGTYPLAYDPAHWVEGLSARFALRAQLSAVLLNLGTFYDLYARQLGGFTALVLVLLALGARRPPGAVVALLAVAAAAHGAYALVYAEARYVAPSSVLLAGASLAAVRLVGVGAERRLLAVCSIVLLAFLGAELVAYELRGLNALTGWVQPAEWKPAIEGGRRARPSEVALALRAAGLAPGDAVGVVGYSYDAFWARLARLRIVAETIPEDAPAFAALRGVARERALAAFAGAGAKAVVIEPGPFPLPPGFARVHASDYGVLFLDAAARDR